MESADNIRIRTAAERDAAELLEIYRPYVENTAVTFEYKVPSLEDFTGRIQNTLKIYPYLVAERDGEALGYTYAGAFVGRAACAWAAEVSIYIRGDCRRAGIGGRLYAAIERVLRAQNVVNLNVSIAAAEAEDMYLTRDSLDFHRHMGYKPVGKFHRCGYKFGRWYDLAWMEKMIGPHDPSPPDMIPFPELTDRELWDMGIWKT